MVHSLIVRRYALTALLTAALINLGWVSDHPTGTPQPETNVALRDIVAAGRLSDLRWPNFSDYSVQVKSFYETSNYAVAWLTNGEPTRQATAVIEVLEQADGKGLNAEDYDGSRWPGRVTGLQQSPSSDA